MRSTILPKEINQLSTRYRGTEQIFLGISKSEHQSSFLRKLEVRESADLWVACAEHLPAFEPNNTQHDGHSPHLLQNTAFDASTGA